jgi:hypothetical protein
MIFIYTQKMCIELPTLLFTLLKLSIKYHLSPAPKTPLFVQKKRCSDRNEVVNELVTWFRYFFEKNTAFRAVQW